MTFLVLPLLTFIYYHNSSKIIFSYENLRGKKPKKIRGFAKMSKEKVNQTPSSRRDFLKTAGKFAVYTPPALMLMSSPGHTKFAKSCTVPGVAYGNPNCDGLKEHPVK